VSKRWESLGGVRLSQNVGVAMPLVVLGTPLSVHPQKPLCVVGKYSGRQPTTPLPYIAIIINVNASVHVGSCLFCRASLYSASSSTEYIVEDDMAVVNISVPRYLYLYSISRSGGSTSTPKIVPVWREHEERGTTIHKVGKVPYNIIFYYSFILAYYPISTLRLLYYYSTYTYHPTPGCEGGEERMKQAIPAGPDSTHGFCLYFAASVFLHFCSLPLSLSLDAWGV
jgi:hypothetical protein